MKREMFVLSMAVLAVSVTPVVSAEETSMYPSSGTVGFIPNTDPTDPVHPEYPDPEKPVRPIDPTDPNGPQPGTSGPLSIDFASSFDFGVHQISNKDETYYARAQSYQSEDGSVSSDQTANYVQVTDNRGSNAGWRLTVKQNGQFKNDRTLNKELTGSVLTLTDPRVKSNAVEVIAPTANENIILDAHGSESLVLSAANHAGAGTWVNSWGTVETVTEKDSNHQEYQTEVTKAVTLFVPGRTPKDAVSYTTTLTWMLSDTPGEE